MLQATVEIEKQNYRNARRYLDSAIAIEFNIQSKPKFQYLSGQEKLKKIITLETLLFFDRVFFESYVLTMLRN